MRDTSVAGVDGCRKGWVVVRVRLAADGAIESNEAAIVRSFQEVLELADRPRFTGVDIPIGLPVEAVPGGRACDREARRKLGRRRGASVFAPPVRGVLSAASYEQALALNRASSRHGIGISKQAYGLVPKLREVHDLMTPDLQLRIREVHPELSFAAMNDGRPMEHSKRTAEGMAERLQLLAPLFAGVGATLKSLPASVRNDAVDAFAAAWSAWRMARGKAHYVPDTPELDSRGLRMGIWY